MWLGRDARVRSLDPSRSPASFKKTRYCSNDGRTLSITRVYSFLFSPHACANYWRSRTRIHAKPCTYADETSLLTRARFATTRSVLFVSYNSKRTVRSFHVSPFLRHARGRCFRRSNVLERKERAQRSLSSHRKRVHDTGSRFCKDFSGARLGR